MLKVSKQVSLALSLVIAVFFFLCCIAGLFILPRLTEMLIDLPDNIGNRAAITATGRVAVLIAAYCILADFMLADSLLFALLLRVKEGDVDARQELIDGNLRLVLSIVQRFANRRENMDDLFQVGWIGLIKAVDHFNTELDVKFSTYAVPMNVRG